MPDRRTRRSPRPQVLLAAVALLGCDAARRGSLKVVDPAIREQPRLEAERLERGFRLGAYEIREVRIRESAVNEGLSTAQGARHPGYRYDLDFTLDRPAAGHRWSTHCVGRREADIHADFGAIAGIQNHRISIRCELVGASTWALAADGRLDANVGGDLRPLGEDESAGLELELLLWSQRARYFRRDLPYPVAQVRQNGHVIAAMLIARPEWAWVDEAAPAERAEVAIAALAAVRLLPLGFEE